MAKKSAVKGEETTAATTIAVAEPATTTALPTHVPTEPTPVADPKPTGTRPAHVLRLRGIRVAAFENVGKDRGVYFKVTIQKVYRDGDEYKTTTSLGRDDLPVAVALMNDMWRWILETEAERWYRQQNGVRVDPSEE